MAFNWDDLIQRAKATDIGMRRSNNQDSLAVVMANDMETWLDRGHLFMVADGMGAHAAGELASELAANGVPHLYRKYVDISPPEALQRAFIETNAEIHRRGQANSDFRHMGTTSSSLVLLPQGALVGHIGDSRVYRLRGDTLEQLTFDHSLIWELKDAGQLSENGDLAQSIPKNVITRSLGPNPQIQVDIEGPLPIVVGDTYLLCSDGLTGKLKDEEIAGVMANLPTEEAAQLMVDLANLRGGPDNITVILAKVISDKIATNTEASDPITLGAERPREGIHPGVWVGVAVGLLAALLLAITRNMIPAAVAAVSGILFGVIGGLAGKFRRPGGVALSGGRKLGRGPYTNTPCMPPEKFVELLADTTRDVRQSASSQDFDINLDKYDAFREASAQATKAKKYRDAALGYARAIRHLMQAVRDEQDRRANDSAIEL